jgi:hypothetical protein
VKGQQTYLLFHEGVVPDSRGRLEYCLPPFRHEPLRPESVALEVLYDRGWPCGVIMFANCGSSILGSKRMLLMNLLVPQVTRFLSCRRGTGLANKPSSVSAEM